MNYRLTIVAVLLTAALSRPGCAVEETAEDQLERLAQEAPKVGLPKLIVFNQAKLKRIFEAKLKTSSPEYRAALQKAQEAWEKFDEADLVVGALDTQGGSGQAVFAMERHVYQLRLRIYQLSTDFVQGWVSVPKVPEPAPR
jgi:uncharacterized protein YecT (DUF1311 family)